MLTRFVRFGLGVLAAAACAAATLAAPALPSRPIGEATAVPPHAIAGGFDLPNGWRITPAGEKLADIGDLVLKLVVAPDRKAVVAVNSGYLPHGLTVIDPGIGMASQRITLTQICTGPS